MDLSLYPGSVVNTIVVNGKRFGASRGGTKTDVPMQQGEIISRLEYGILNDGSKEVSGAICALSFITNRRKHGPYAGKVIKNLFDFDVFHDK